MTNFRRAVFTAVMTVFAQLLSAQTGVSLESEIQNMEREANKQGISSAQRHETLVRLAGLKQLSGDIEGAAKNWLEAAGAVPGKVDDDALLACAHCLAAMGEWDRSAAALEPLLAKSARARFLNTGIRAIQSGDTLALAALADNPQYSQMKNEIYFMLWKTSRGQAAERWRRQLIAEYPQSPEGRLAAGEPSSAIIVRPSPFWLFAGGLDSLPLTAETFTVAKPSPAVTAPVQSIAPETAVQAKLVSQPSAPAQVAVSPQVTASSAGAVRLQTGLYSRQTNADKQMENLKKAGFSPSLEERNEMWAVTVPAGADTNRTIAELRAAGFDSFPLK